MDTITVELTPCMLAALCFAAEDMAIQLRVIREHPDDAQLADTLEQAHAHLTAVQATCCVSH